MLPNFIKSGNQDQEISECDAFRAIVVSQQDFQYDELVVEVVSFGEFFVFLTEELTRREFDNFHVYVWALHERTGCIEELETVRMVW